MTFYWWSHWFWITLLSNVLLSIVYVHSYPSHDIAPDYNSNNNDNKNTKTAVTKLYQTTTKFIRPTATTTTATPPIRRVTEETVGQRKTRLQNIPRTEAAAVDSIEEGEEAGEEETVEKTYKENVAVEEEDNPTDEYGDYEVKRSTDENESNSNKIRAESDTVIGQQDQKAERQSDETAKQGAASSSLDRRSGDIKASEEQSSHPKRQEKETKDFSEHPNLTNFSKTATKNDNNKTETQATAAASSWIPSQPQIENDSPATVKCLDSAEEQSTHNQQADGGDDNPSGAHKVSFTLENVNKEEEILRAESEHRSRKSKELSAEYNHVSRFINFSTDSKNLLTRSASSTSNEYDSDEGNISSEALAIKRTAYFLDASAISAICFTAFGVCCTVGTLGVVLYRRRFLNKPQVLSEPDSSVYIDDSTIRDNSDEMYSLDNDSFLNSLEAMTIQNYWTDSVKHTKL